MQKDKTDYKLQSITRHIKILYAANESYGVF